MTMFEIVCLSVGQAVAEHLRYIAFLTHFVFFHSGVLLCQLIDAGFEIQWNGVETRISVAIVQKLKLNSFGFCQNLLLDLFDQMP